MERRLIDANVLISEVHRYDEQQKNDKWLTSDIEALLEEQPTVDAVEVVRCKNCKCAYINSFSAASGVAVCKKWSNEAETAIVQHDDFCSYGERRTDV